MVRSTNERGGRPTIACTHGVVASRHYLAAEAPPLRVRLEFRKIRQYGRAGIIAYGHKAVPAV